MTNTAVVETSNSEVERQAALEIADAFAGQRLKVPILKIGQGLTKEVQNGDAEQGDLINSLTTRSYGPRAEFIITNYGQGRFAANNDGAFSAFGHLIPDRWGELLGEEWVGTPFAEHPESEEKFKAAVNAKERPWGHGPQISTTHNYTGLIVVPGEEGSDEPDELDVVRLSLKRIDVPTHEKISTIIRLQLRNKSQWSSVFDLRTARRTFNKKEAYVLEAALGRKTTPTEQAVAQDVHLNVKGGNTQDNAEEVLGEKPPEPDAKGGAAI